MHRRLVSSLLLAAVMAASLLGPASAFAAQADAAAASTTRAQLAGTVLRSTRITLATFHSSGVVDRANAHQEIVDTSKGLKARRSCYGTAPCGSVLLDVAMLRGMLALRNSYRFRVSEIAGGSHSATSRHYRGTAFDVDILDGQGVSASNPHFRTFMQRCRALGAIEVLGPGDPDHATHIHCAWP
jgi:zinc D-Ala-D-Ala carboxypeptidase